MVRAKTEAGWFRMGTLAEDPDFFISSFRGFKKIKPPKPEKIFPSFPPIFEHYEKYYLFRLARESDLPQVVSFVDHLLASHDFFCPRGQHLSYFKEKTVLVCFDIEKLIGWAVRQKNGALIHLLVDPDYRGKGIGKHMLQLLEPTMVRSKSDQSTGDPLKFYEKQGYIKTTNERIGKHKNIDLLSREIRVEKPDKKETENSPHDIAMNITPPSQLVAVAQCVAQQPTPQLKEPP